MNQVVVASVQRDTQFGGIVLFLVGNPSSRITFNLRIHLHGPATASVMFKKFTQDLTGSADICSCVTEAEIAKLQAVKYLLPKETVAFAFQSAKDEFVFTNQALLEIVGENATTTRRSIVRYEYREHVISQVEFETTGRIDRDCEIKLVIGDHECSIDIARKEEPVAQRYVQALVALQREQADRIHAWQLAQDAMDATATALKLRQLNLKDKEAAETVVSPQATELLKHLQQAYDQTQSRCYQNCFQQALARV